MKTDRFFVGWETAPDINRRGFALGAVALTLGGAGLAAALARAQSLPQSGFWDQGDVRDWRGVLQRAPYPILRTTDIDGVARTAFLTTSGKTSVAPRLPRDLEGPVLVRASLIRRDDAIMLAAIDGADWIAPDPGGARLAAPAEEDLGPVFAIGEILDAKCWFGAMRPGFGKTHKACAALCARGGLPLAFCVSRNGVCGEASDDPLFLDAEGRAHGRAIIPYVGDPVSVEGRLVRVGDVTQLRASLNAIRRL
ncbi:MAG: hypothetical protein GC189_06470 [Alphaproteobacteria bacterium]|nr:hypothetical protein [Alphaproteobacteria bacterium]